MRRSSVGKLGVILACVVFVATGVASAADHMFVGATKCMTCHKKPEQGEQYPKWLASKHAKAYATLATPEALEVGKKLGVAEPQKDAKCLKCHVTGHGAAAALLGPKYNATEGVTCESCHGAGGDYIKKSTMEGLTSGTIAPASVGLTVPDQKTCEKCHNQESPSFKGFDYAKAKEKIAHPLPAALKATYKKPAAQ
jgi:hypothetical protein